MAEYIIIGAGPAGVIAAEELRKQDADANITLIGDEPELPYSRMALPYLLSGRIDEQGTYLRKNPGYFKQRRITFLQDQVTSLNTKAKQVVLRDSTIRNFDKLLIAAGSSPITPPNRGMNLANIHHCWTLEDARYIIKKATPGAHVTLIGAGFIGSIILEALSKRGVKLTVVEMNERMVPRMMDDISGNMIKKWCEEKNVTLFTSTKVESVEEVNNRLKIKLTDKGDLDTDLIILAAGVKANIGFLAGSGIETDSGVLVNEYMQSSHPDIYAAGDVCQGKDFSTSEYNVQAIQPTAADHGRIAALNISGKSIPHQGSINMNVLDTFGLVSASYGLWMGVEGGDSVKLYEPERYRYLCLQFKDDVIVGAQTIGMTQHIGVLRGLIQSRTKLGKRKADLMRNPSGLMEAYLGTTQSIGHNIELM